MKYFFYNIFGFFLSLEIGFATERTVGIGVSPDNSITDGNTTDWDLTRLLSFIQEILLKVALPLVIVGSALYIAYELFLAQGNEEKMKQAWKSITYSFIGVIAIALGYAIISLASRLSI